MLKRIAFAGLIAVSSLALAQDAATFDGLGGKPGIKKIVDTLLPIVLADPRIKDSFQDIDMKHLGMRLEEQFCMLSGGPCVYKGKDMVDIHDGLNITNAQFNALAEDLQIAMERNGVPSRIQNKLVAKLAPMQRGIVTK
jgi:hemoglobin